MFAFCVVALYARQPDALALELWLKHHDPTLARCTHDTSRRFTGCINDGHFVTGPPAPLLNLSSLALAPSYQAFYISKR